MAVNKQVKKMFLFGFVSLTGIVDIYIYIFLSTAASFKCTAS